MKASSTIGNNPEQIYQSALMKTFSSVHVQEYTLYIKQETSKGIKH